MNEENKMYLKEIEKMEKILNEDLIKQKNKTENIKQIISKMKKMNNITLRLPDELEKNEKDGKDGKINKNENLNFNIEENIKIGKKKEKNKINDIIKLLKLEIN